MEIAKIAAVGLMACVLAVTLKKTKPEIAVQISIAAGIIILLMILDYLREAVNFIKEFADSMRGMYEGTVLVLKVIGIAYIGEFASDALNDAGESAIAKKVDLAGKVIITVMTLPLFKQFAQVVLSLAEGL